MRAIVPPTTPSAHASAEDLESKLPFTEALRNIVVIGASAGGVLALRQLVSRLPADYAGALFVVVHISAGARSELAGILGRAGPLPAVQAEDGMPITHGRIHVAMPDHHLLIERGRMRVVHGPRENRHRPAIDPLFRSAAWSYGPRVVGVVLTGNLDDGTSGLWAIKSCGGTTVVQDPADAEHPEMPSNALLYNEVDHRLPVSDMAGLLVQLGRQVVDVGVQAARSTAIADEVGFAALESDIDDMRQFGAPSAFTCPTCRGALWELEEGGHLRYRCHTGHAFSQDSLQVEQTAAVEEHLYAALRALEEKAAALRRLAERWPERLPGVRDDYVARAEALDRSANALRAMLAGGEA